MKLGGEAFSSIDIVVQCLLDKRRVAPFARAIKLAVKRGDLVLDVGSGTGILAMFAARAHARKVVALEFDPYIASLARKAIVANKLARVVRVVVADARTHRYRTVNPFDIVIMEMLTTGMVDEFQVQAVNNLHRQGLIDSHTQLIPERQDTYVTLGFYDFENYHLQLPVVRHLWRFMPKSARAFRKMSTRSLLSSVSFHTRIPEKFAARIRVPVRASGTVNALLLESVTTLMPRISVGDTNSINGPVVIPLQPQRVKAGTEIQLDVRYTFGGGYASFIEKLTL